MPRFTGAAALRQLPFLLRHPTKKALPQNGQGQTGFATKGYQHKGATRRRQALSMLPKNPFRQSFRPIWREADSMLSLIHIWASLLGRGLRVAHERASFAGWRRSLCAAKRLPRNSETFFASFFGHKKGRPPGRSPIKKGVAARWQRPVRQNSKQNIK